MTAGKRYPARSMHICNVCGKEEFWQPSWVRFSSPIHDETCFADMPEACGETCRKELSLRIKNETIVPPKLGFDAGGGYVIKERSGY